MGDLMGTYEIMYPLPMSRQIDNFVGSLIVCLFIQLRDMSILLADLGPASRTKQPVSLVGLCEGKERG